MEYGSMGERMGSVEQQWRMGKGDCNWLLGSFSFLRFFKLEQEGIREKGFHFWENLSWACGLGFGDYGAFRGFSASLLKWEFGD